MLHGNPTLACMCVVSLAAGDVRCDGVSAVTPGAAPSDLASSGWCATRAAVQHAPQGSTKSLTADRSLGSPSVTKCPVMVQHAHANVLMTVSVFVWQCRLACMRNLPHGCAALA